MKDFGFVVLVLGKRRNFHDRLLFLMLKLVSRRGCKGRRLIFYAFFLQFFQLLFKLILLLNRIFSFFFWRRFFIAQLNALLGGFCQYRCNVRVVTSRLWWHVWLASVKRWVDASPSCREVNLGVDCHKSSSSRIRTIFVTSSYCRVDRSLHPLVLFSGHKLLRIIIARLLYELLHFRLVLSPVHLLNWRFLLFVKHFGDIFHLDTTLFVRALLRSDFPVNHSAQLW